MTLLKKQTNKLKESSTQTAGASRPLGLFLIGLFKLMKGALFTALGIGMLKLINKDIDDLFLDLISKLHIDAEHRFIQHIVAHLSLVTNHTLHELITISFIFAALLFIEAFGLLWEKVWAEFVAIVETSLFIPFEVYEIVRHATFAKVAIITINSAIVAYLLLAIIRKSNDDPNTLSPI
jgi:uncharacterized membrane protein (DUF2068 family)